MTDKQVLKKGNTKPVAARPGQDIVAAKAGAKFPAVGMSLPAYQQSARQTAAPYKPSAAAAGSKLKTSRNPKKIIKRVAIVLLVIAIIIGGWLGGKLLYNAHKLFGGNILGVLQTTKLKGEDNGRVTILLAGNSADDTGHSGADLTDSILLLSVDTVSHSAYMLSVPRDLWVDVPGSGHQKINSTYVVGNANSFSDSGYPKGGMGQLEQVITDNLGVKINYYALVNYTALRQAVDAVGGIDYTVHSTDPRGLYDPNIDYTTNKSLVKLTNGLHHLNGEAALNLARARGDSSRSYGFAGSDFDRTQHQREMLTALKSKAVSAGTLSNPAKLSSLADAIGGNVKTDLSISEVRRLYDVTKDINNSSIRSVGFNNVDGASLLTNYQAPNGASALIPLAGLDDFSDMQSFIKRLNSHDPVVQEGAKVVLLNATDTRGLAGTVRSTLTSKNLNIIAIADAKSIQAVTSIIDLTTPASAKPGTKKFLTQTFGNHVSPTNAYGNQYDADFIVLLGADQLAKQAQN